MDFNWAGFLFWFLLIFSVILFIYALYKKSWVIMASSGILLMPDVWYFSGYPPFPLVKYLPLLHLLLALLFYIKNKKMSSQNK